MNSKYIFFVILVFSSLYSCKPQKPAMDLNKDVLGSSIKELSLDQARTKESSFIPNSDYGATELQLGDDYGFENENYSGHVEQGKNLGTNQVDFIYNKKDNLVAMYHMSLYQTDKTQQLINKLDNLLGKASFTRFSNEEGKVDTLSFSHKVWENKVDGKTYFLEVKPNTVIYQNEVEASFLTVVTNSEEVLIEWSSSGGFGYWGDYLKYRARFKDKSYTYQDFINDKADKGADYYKKRTQ